MLAMKLKVMIMEKLEYKLEVKLFLGYQRYQQIC